MSPEQKDEVLRRYKASITVLREQYPERAKMIVNLCKRARKYEWSEKTKREEDRSALIDAPTASKDARDLARFLSRYPSQSSFPVIRAINDSGIRLRPKRSRSPTGGLMLAALLECLSRELSKRENSLLAQAGPFEHRFRVGPLMFSQPIEKQSKLPDERTCLAVMLLFLFRKLSITGSMRWSRGEIMPSGGGARWKLIAQLVNDTYGGTVKAPDLSSKVSKLLKRHPNLTICGYS